METDNEDNYKIVNLSYTEQASVIVKAEDNDDAEAAVHDSFPDIPDLKILSIEDADPELVAEVKQSRLEKEAEGKVYN